MSTTDEATMTSPQIEHGCTTASQCIAAEKRKMWAVRQEKLKADYPNHGAPWHAADDADLIRTHSCGISVTEIGKCMGRNSGAIRSRLMKHAAAAESH